MLCLLLLLLHYMDCMIGIVGLIKVQRHLVSYKSLANLASVVKICRSNMDLSFIYKVDHDLVTLNKWSKR